MPRAVFGPRRPFVSVPPPPNLTPQQPAGRVVIASPEMPPADQLAGRVTLAPWGIVQPVQRPTPLVVAVIEEPQPEAGRAHVSKPPMDHRPTGRTVVARGEDQRPAEGRTEIGRVGYPEPRRNGRVIVAAAEVRAPAPGTALVAKSPPPDESAQQLRGAVLVAATENAPPFAGWCFARQKPLVPSDRRPTPLVFARVEEPRPFAGDAIALRVKLGHPPPGRFVFTIARREEPLPESGNATKLGPAVEALTPQQLPGRVVIARVEDPRPDWIARGQALVWTGYRAGAIGPSLVGATPGGRLVRADAWNRSIRRLPRMGNAMTYVTRTKAPDETLAVVFDFANFPEIVGGAEIVSAVVSGPGGAPLTGLVAGTPAVLTSVAVIDSLGNTVAAGKGVEVALAGGGVGDDVVVSCAATLGTGSVCVVQGKIAVRNAV